MAAAAPKTPLANGQHQQQGLLNGGSSHVPRLRPLFKGMCIGVAIGVVYSLSMWYIVTQLKLPIGIGLRYSANSTWAATATPDADKSWINPELWADQQLEEAAAESGGVDPQRIKWLMTVWESSLLLTGRSPAAEDNTGPDPAQSEAVLEARRQLGNVSLLAAPHLEDCLASAQEIRRLDSRGPRGVRPAWSLWKGRLGLLDRDPPPVEVEGEVELEDEQFLGNKAGLVWGPYPPWVDGADEDNLPMTRRAQRDIWMLQHPRDCNDPNLRFLAPHWSGYEHYGLGAQIHHMTGMFAIAMRERRVLVMQDFNRAGHAACKGHLHRRWSCYFVPETPPACRRRAEQLLTDPQAIADGKVWLEQHIPSMYNTWMGEPSDLWGKPWDHMQPTMEIEGELYTKLHKYRDVRWWRSQALRYLMRFQSKYTCLLMNRARHEAFGAMAAANVIRAADQRAEVALEERDMEKWVWSNQKPWIPRPMVNVHVRMGDKATEMKMVQFAGYMRLAERLRARFPHLRHVWLSTEMQSVVDEASGGRAYPGWRFHFTRVPRQGNDTSMAAYLASLGAETASATSVVNFLMAADSDFFVGALGSSWCYLIDSMRSTGGKLGAGYLSVNVDRFWRRKRRKLLALLPRPQGQQAVQGVEQDLDLRPVLFI